MKMRFLRLMLGAIFWVSVSHNVQAQPIGEEQAMKIPIVDAHFHPMPFMTPEELISRMDKHNITHAGGAPYAGPFKKHWQFAKKMEKYGDRFIRAEGASQIVAMMKKSKKKALEDADHPVFQKFYGLIEAPILSSDVRVIGEVFVNTRTSSKDPAKRWKVKGDSSAIKALFDLATDHGIPMMIHTQADSDTLKELGRLVDARPDGVLVFGHCGKDSTADKMREVLEKHPNTHCNIAYRFPPQERSKDEKRYIFRYGSLKEDWRKLVEDYPDRFMIGIDDVHDWAQYEEVAKTLRKDFLAKLEPETAKKVASENALKLYKLN